MAKGSKKKKNKQEAATDAAASLLAELEKSAGISSADEGEEEGSENEEMEGGSGTDGSKKKKKKGKGKKGKSKKKGKKKKKKGKEGDTTETDTKPKYTQKDIDDYKRKKEREKRKRKEKKLVAKMQEMISIVRPEDERWTVKKLAPLYEFLRNPNVQVITVFLKKTETLVGYSGDRDLFWRDYEPDDDSRFDSGDLNLADLFSDDNNEDEDEAVQTPDGDVDAYIDNVDLDDDGDEDEEEGEDEERSEGGGGNEEEGAENKQVQVPKKKVKKVPKPTRSQLIRKMMTEEANDFRNSELMVTNEVIQNKASDIFFFVKLKQMKIDRDNFFFNVLYGNLPGGYLASLNSLLTHVYSPMFYQPNVLPESIRNEFFKSIDAVMSSLTETYNRLQCQTVLYVPKEAMQYPIDLASRDRELCSRLEAAMVHWIRQIKEVVMNQRMTENDYGTGPLEEIQFWKSRRDDLAGLAAQIKSREVRTVKQIMSIIKSPFVTNFEMVSSEILGASEEAISNLKALEVLIEPCTILQKSKVKDILEQLPPLLDLVRKIWLTSRFYNTLERLNGLLRKISNEIISHCVREIRLDRIFSGHIDSSEEKIHQCIDCCKQWKEAYFAAERFHHQNSPYLSWLLEYDHIFSHVDCFIHRLQDLLEICACQRLYGRRVEGNRLPLPPYPGPKGSQMTRVMQEVQKKLDKHLKQIHNCSHLILDVRNNKWHDHMISFKATARDIEMMILNVLFQGFDMCQTLTSGIEILEAFYGYYHRDVIKRAYDKLVVKLYKLFEEATNRVRSLFVNYIVPNPPNHPQLAERAAWCVYLEGWLKQEESLLDAAPWLPECGFGDDKKEQASVLSKTLANFVDKLYDDWIKALGPKDLEPRLEIPLMTRSSKKFGMIDVNFDAMLSRLMIEADIWTRLGYEIPEVFMGVYWQRKRLNRMRETVSLVVQDYNEIILGLTTEERNLFKERIKLINRKVYPGITKLTWASDVSDAYVNDCRLGASKVQGFINDYKKANAKIAKISNIMSNLLMVKIDQKRIYERNEFNDYQHKYRSRAVLRLAKLYKKITLVLRNIFEMFKEDGQEVKVQWLKYLKKIDEIVEEALILNVRRCLELLHRTVHGDVRGPPAAILKLDIILDSRNRLNFYPPLPIMEDMILGIYRRICISVQNFPRVVQFLSDPNFVVDSFSRAIAKDKVAKTIQGKVSQGVRFCMGEIEKYLATWEPYKDVWEIDKDEFMKRYEKQNPSIKSYETDIARYYEVNDAVQGCETVVPIIFGILDCGPLKNTIAEQCRQWQARLKASLQAKKDAIEAAKAEEARAAGLAPSLAASNMAAMNVDLPEPKVTGKKAKDKDKEGAASKPETKSKKKEKKHK